jgi:hypothetical protein
MESGARWLMSMLDTGLLRWLLMPFKWVLAPFFATGLKDFALALAPAAALLLVHYYWVLHMEVSFEEASLDQAEKRANRRAGLRTGDFRFGQAAVKARRPAFQLRSTGWPEIAFLWKNLLSTRSFFSPRMWLICAGLIIVSTQVAGRMDLMEQNILSGIGAGVLVLGIYVVLFGPLVARLDLRSDLAHADVLKTFPLPGWRIVLGELLAPIAILTGIIWLALLLGVGAFQPPSEVPAWLSPSLRVTYAACFALVTPALVALQLLVPNAAAVVFPAWFQATRTVGGGIDLMGQRLIFVFGQIFIIVLALIPAAATAAILIFVTQWKFGAGPAVVFATFGVLMVMLGELWCAVWWLGQRFERLDLSLDQRP